MTDAPRFEGGVVLDLAPAGSFEDKLWSLTQAAIIINSQRSVDEMLTVITEQARRIIGAHLGSTSLTVEGTGSAELWPQRSISVSLSPRYARWEDYARTSHGAPWYGLVCADNDVVRMTQAELLAHPLWRDFGEEGPHHPPMRGWLAAPLIASDGRNLGILQLSDRYEGDFDGEDEAILVQLAQLASIAVEKAQLAIERDRQGEQLRALADAAVAISTPLGVREILDRITRVALDLIGAHQAVTSLTDGRSLDQAITSVALSERYAAWSSYDVPPDGSGIYRLVPEANAPMRLTQEELEAHPAWRGFGDHAADHPPMRGWMAVPLRTASGRNLGMIQLSDRTSGDFTADDEALLAQLARLASVAIENAQLQEELVHQERHRLTQDLLAGVSHDMQTPLAVILGLATELCASTDEADQEQLELTGLLEAHAHRLQQLVQQFLDYVRVEAGEAFPLRLVPVPLADVLDQAVGASTAFDRVEVHVDPDVSEVTADAARLVQVVANLVGNALKFSTGPVQVHATRADGRVRVDVVDHGVGIPEPEQPMIFSKLYRGEEALRSRVPGQGIGLYVSRVLVEAMGGALTVASRVGVGSRFSIHLDPVREVDARAEGRGDASSDDAQRSA
jgi:signal transduction histidine kinase